jgi:hypothetical protein
LRKQLRHFPQEARSFQSSIRSRPQDDAIQPTDVPVGHQFQIELLERFQARDIGGGAEHARILLRPHIRRHRGERKDVVRPYFLRVGHHPSAKGVFPLGGLRFTNEHDPIPLPLRIFPNEIPAAGKIGRPDDAVLDLDMVDIEHAFALHLGQQMHL